MEYCECPTSLVKEEQIIQDSRTENTSHTAEKSRKESGDDEGVELVLMDHECAPYLCEQASNQGPEDD